MRAHFVFLEAASVGVFLRKLGWLGVEGRERGRSEGVNTFLWIHSKTKRSEKLRSHGPSFIGGFA